MVKKMTMPIRLSHDVWLWLKKEALRQWEATGKYTTPDKIIRQLIEKEGGMLNNNTTKDDGEPSA